MQALVVHLLYFLFTISRSSSLSPMNFHFTDDETNSHLQHHCLFISFSSKYSSHVNEIHPFCLAEPASTWTIETNHVDQRFTFQELQALNITSDQLRSWSASFDLIDRYQQYLEMPSLSNSSSSWFFNCTAPRFGPECQFSFDHPQADRLSVQELVDSFYRNPFRVEQLTCYTHLTCDRGSSLSCLDWSEICDGYVDCLNDAIDEKDCWKLEINQCTEDEYRCDNGQCIPRIFNQDKEFQFECLDRSDETHVPCWYNGLDDLSPTFSRDDTVNTIHRRGNPRALLASSCVDDRDRVLRSHLQTELKELLSKKCWCAARCHIGDIHSKDIRCKKLCSNNSCQQSIKEFCPAMMMIPEKAILFGHLQIAYARDLIIQDKNLSAAEYICYNHRLCGGFDSNRTLLMHQNLTCRRPEDFPLVSLQNNLIKDIFESIEALYHHLSQCNTIIYDKPDVCQSPQMYQCRHSSKCISISRLCDGVYDCDYKEDEHCPYINGTCFSVKPVQLFPCEETQKCISMILYNDFTCDCNPAAEFTCDDEPNMFVDWTRRISFPTICDGFIELLPIVIDGREEDDETHCHNWQCNNTYTRCDGFWNCLNGADEVDCPTPSSLASWTCPPRSHRCVSLTTAEATCLPIDKIDDGEIDCAGATDEPRLCRYQSHFTGYENFYCHNSTTPHCIFFDTLCHPNKNCVYGNQEPFCRPVPSMEAISSSTSSDLFNAYLIQTFLEQRPNEMFKPTVIYFSLTENYSSRHSPSAALIQQKASLYIHNYRCHRGLPLKVWTDSHRNTTQTTCLCPPSYYGPQCRFQNQRVTLTLQLQTFADSRQTLFSLFIFLIDHTDQRLIHSYHSITYLYAHHCQRKFNFYLLYASRPKSIHTNYSIHIDIYEKISFIYRGSILIPIHFPFLPVYRTALHLFIPSISHIIKTCHDLPCQHGRCVRYIRSDHPTLTSFCQCDSGWTGQLCHLPYQHPCQCHPSHGRCLAQQAASNRSICLCSLHRWGPSCRFHNHACQSDHHTPICLHGGTCLTVTDDGMMENDEFICLCPKGYSGKRCEQIDLTLHISFHPHIHLPSFALIHFIEVIDQAPPEQGATFKTIPFYRNSLTVQWSRPFHIVIVEFLPRLYYLALVQKRFDPSSSIKITIDPSDHCPHLDQLLNQSIVNAHLLIRIKYYHHVCEKRSSLSCFYDREHFCLCIDEDDRRYANCFEFNPWTQHDCSGMSVCEHGGRCLQDRLICPQTSACLCADCYYGTRCQFTSHLFGVSLDGILGYYIQPGMSITDQSSLIKMSAVIVMVMVVVGYVNGILSLMTFSNKKTREVGCGYYLLGTSLTSLLTVTMFGLKYWILLISQMHEVRHRGFLYGQCLLIDLLLRMGLSMDRWLNACVAIERSLSTRLGVNFNKEKSKNAAKYIILLLMGVILVSLIHDPTHRELYDEDDGSFKRTWCVVRYSSRWQYYNRSIEVLHFGIPFIINIASAMFVLTSIVRKRRRTLGNRHQQRAFRQNRHILITPIFLVILALPGLIISCTSGCLKSGRETRLLLIGYLTSFLPVLLCFTVFVLPSTLYKTEFHRSWSSFREKLLSRFRSISM